MKLTIPIIRAASQDAGNRNMKNHGRTVWNREDWNAACEEFERLTASMVVTERTVSPCRS